MAMTFVMPYGQLTWLRGADEAVARKAFDTPSSFIVGNSVPSGYDAVPLPTFYSFETYAAAGQTQTGQAFPWVCADYENWPATHPKVKRHPEAAFWHFTTLAHLRGQKVVAAPSRDLIYCPGTDRGWQAPEDINAGYIRCLIPAAGEDADVLLVQNQGAEKDTETYARMLIAAAKQTPTTQTLWGGLTTNFATAAQMKAAYDAAALSGAPVTGYWVTIASQAQAPVAADFFRSVT